MSSNLQRDRIFQSNLYKIIIWTWQIHSGLVLFRQIFVLTDPGHVTFQTHVAVDSALCAFSMCGALEKHLLTYLLTYSMLTERFDLPVLFR